MYICVMSRRHILVKLTIGAVALTGACDATGVLGGRQTVNTGKVRSFVPERVCISSRTPDGPGEKCFRLDDDIKSEGAIGVGDLVEVWFEDGLATELRPVPPH